MLELVLVALSLAASPPVPADQPLPGPQTTTGFGTLRPAQPDPFRKLFEVQPDLKAAPPPAAAAKPKIVCGMTIIPADPTIDPKMRLAPKSDGVNYTIRAIDPPICNPAR